MSILTRLFLLIFLLAVGGVDSYASDQLQSITLVGNSRKPPIYWLENGRPQGILVDMLGWISEQSGYRFNIELYPWARAYQLAVAGSAGVVGISMTDKRLSLFDYSEPLFYDEMMLVVLKGKEFPFAVMDDLRGKRVAATRGGLYGAAYEKAIDNVLFDVVEINSLAQGLRMVRDGRVDVVLVGHGVLGLQFIIRADSSLASLPNQFSVLPTPLARDPNYIAFAKSMGKQSLIKDLNRYIKQGWESGVFDKIIDRYKLEGGVSIE